MPETKFTEFPALSVDPKVGISRSASETDVWLFVLAMTLSINTVSLIFDILRRIKTFESHSMIFVFFSWWCKNGITIKLRDLEPLLTSRVNCPSP